MGKKNNKYKEKDKKAGDDQDAQQAGSSGQSQQPPKTQQPKTAMATAPAASGDSNFPPWMKQPQQGQQPAQGQQSSQQQQQQRPQQGQQEQRSQQQQQQRPQQQQPQQGQQEQRSQQQQQQRPQQQKQPQQGQQQQQQWSQQGQQQQRPQQQQWPQQGQQQQSQQRSGQQPQHSQPLYKASGQQQDQRGQRQPPQQGGNQRGSTASLSSGMSGLSVVPKNVSWQPGSRGTRIRVEVNYLKLVLNNLVNTAYHYDVAFEPERPKKFLPAALTKFREKNFPKFGFAFDGQKNLFTTKVLPMKTEEFEDTVAVICQETNREKTFKVKIKKVNQIDLLPLKNYVNQVNAETPQLALQCVDVVLRSAHDKPHILQCKRAFYNTQNKRDKLGQTNFELWYGLFQAAVLGWTPYLNIDIAHKAFPMPIPVLRMIYDPNRFGPRDRDNLFNDLRGLNFVYTPPDAPESKKMYRSNGLGDPANKYTFEQDGRRITVADYFRGKGCALQYPGLPLLLTAGTAALPLEFCTVAANQTAKRAPEECKRDMIKFAAIPSYQRKDNIMNMVNNTKYNSNDIIKEFGITVGDKFENIDARILPPPALEYANGRQITARSGVWRADNEAFITPKKIVNWSVIVMDNRVRNSDVDSFVKSFQTQARRLRMEIGDPNDIDYNLSRIRGPKTNDIEKVMTGMQKSELIVCIIPEGDAYAQIKQVAELKLGILTQCIKSRTLGRMDLSCVNNILLKVNAKINGSNHRIGESRQNSSLPKLLKTKNFMVMGADVTHPSPDQSAIPSLVGVAASSDIDAFQYNCCYRIQGARIEMIDNFGDILKEHLNVYRKQNQDRLPDLILYYRDGVSDGQFQQVLDIEYTAMVKACSQIKAGYAPKITILVVQKRHHTRFFPAPGQDSDGKNKNVIPGTVIDRDIVDPGKKQFFMVAHASIQGVAKPAKYQVLLDDSNFSADVLQELTYSLCHLFTRCNRTVSYVAPTYYAHLVAFRARSYIKNAILNMSNLTLEYSRRQIVPSFTNRNPMFFV